MSEELHKFAEREMLGDLLGDDATPDEAQAKLDAPVPQDTEEQPQADQPDTDGDTGQPDTAPDTGGQEAQPTVNWAESQIAKEYGDPDAAWRAIREKEQRIGHLSNLAFNRPQPEPKKPEPVRIDPDSFSIGLQQNPVGTLTDTLKQLGYISREEAAQIAQQSATEMIEEERVNQFMRSTPDFETHRQKMYEIATQYPGIANMPHSQAYPILYQLAKAAAQPAKPQVQVVPSDPVKKERAKTSGGRSQPTAQRPAANIKPEDWGPMSPEKIEEMIGFGDTE